MLISLTGPSGIGKGYIKKHLLHVFPELREVVWLTTRPLRQDETADQSNREHVTYQEFQSLVEQDEVLFVQRLYDHCYGVRKSGLWFTTDGYWMAEFHIENLLEAKKTGLNMFAIGLVPDGLAILTVRLTARGSEDTDSIRQRLESSREEVSQIQLNRHLFDEVFTISADNQHMICAVVSHAIGQKMKR